MHPAVRVVSRECVAQYTDTVNSFGRHPGSEAFLLCRYTDNKSRRLACKQNTRVTKKEK